MAHVMECTHNGVHAWRGVHGFMGITYAAD